ncbi:MAG: FGGY family carbohydrate kinase [Candidatus Sumerlaeota bacterium]|nr:FGGY family carbohydrate kinase [Candidatus Sumerlaeota bacterium]
MLLGLDIGTSKVAAVLLNEDRRVIASSSRPHGADLATAEEGFAEQNPDAIIEATWNAIRDLPEDGRRQTRAVGVCGQMHGVVVLDKANRPLTPLITWQDRRCLKNNFAAELSAHTGYTVQSGFGGTTLAWLSAHGKLPAQSAAAATIHDWAVALLCGGVPPVTDPTDAASWGFFDLKTLDWDSQAWEKAGIPRALRPRVLSCGAKAGEVPSPIAATLGIPAGIPVAAAIGNRRPSLGHSAAGCAARLEETRQDLGIPPLSRRTLCGRGGKFVRRRGLGVVGGYGHIVAEGIRS